MCAINVACKRCRIVQATLLERGRGGKSDMYSRKEDGQSRESLLKRDHFLGTEVVARMWGKEWLDPDQQERRIGSGEMKGMFTQLL